MFRASDVSCSAYSEGIDAILRYESSDIAFYNHVIITNKSPGARSRGDQCSFLLASFKTA